MHAAEGDGGGEGGVQRGNERIKWEGLLLYEGGKWSLGESLTVFTRTRIIVVRHAAILCSFTFCSERHFRYDSYSIPSGFFFCRGAHSPTDWERERRLMNKVYFFFRPG